ncbi:Nudix hydrolase 3 [Vitis vinifera]|uniref:Nudix hydrolase 3 n=1 Tax=Vitis vinifera TaxID=29760 RepID=A0A438JX23_VITVI|nr:Nudix hydrolase 3 [Vitis vinifera]
MFSCFSIICGKSQESEVSAVKYISCEEYKRLLAKEDPEYVPYDVNGKYGQLFDIIAQRYKENMEERSLTLQKQLRRYVPISLEAEISSVVMNHCVLPSPLVDLPLQGGSFTWSGGLYNQAWARLDRFLVSPSWLDQFSNGIQKRLPRPISDHFPILIEGGGIRRGPSPFRDVFGSLESNKFAALLQVKYWDQLSRELWLREGDRNTGYFHRMTIAHRRRNSMDKIKINGIWLSEEQEVRTRIADAFKQLLTEDLEWKADIGGLNLNQISHQEAEILAFPFSEDEVHSALMDMKDKAPGSDGFTVAFWQCCWEFVKEEVLEMFKEFHEQNSFLKSLNNTFLVLLPKKGGAEELGGFRPISLLGGLYKLLAKVLANRIKKVIGKVVSSDQNAFVMDRQILDASLIAN